MKGEIIKVGQGCKIVDEFGVLRDALCTAVWGGPDAQEQVTINVVFVVGDERKTDTYGRQKEHYSSIMHRDHAGAPGRYWFVAGERRP